jgi:hypothetical protein
MDLVTNISVALPRCEAQPLSLQLAHFMYCDDYITLCYPATLNVFTAVSR